MGLPLEWLKRFQEAGMAPADVPQSSTSPEVHTAKEPTDAELVLWAVRQAGYGEPEREFRFHEKRKWRFDWAWPGAKVAFEREGGRWRTIKGVRFLVSRHSSEKGYSDDCEKYNAAAVSGWAVIRATPQMMRDGRALAALLEALSRRTGGPPPDSRPSGKEVA